MKTHVPQIVEKSWGYELIIHNSYDYCGKLLVFAKAGNKFSMHYHLSKNESWYVSKGKFMLYWYDTDNGTLNGNLLLHGECIDVAIGQPHQLVALEDDSTIFEVSERHVDSDSYRIQGVE